LGLVRDFYGDHLSIISMKQLVDDPHPQPLDFRMNLLKYPKAIGWQHAAEDASARDLRWMLEYVGFTQCQKPPILQGSDPFLAKLWMIFLCY